MMIIVNNIMLKVSIKLYPPVAYSKLLLWWLI